MLGRRSSGWMGLAFLAGLGLFIALTAWQGFGTIAETLAVAGWRIGWLVPAFVFPLAAATWAWGGLFARAERPGIPRLIYARWVGFAVNQLLPVARIGGEVVRARLVFGAGAPGASVVASVVADKTAQVASVALFAVVGLGLLALRAVAPELVGPGLAGIAGVAVAGVAFYVTQRRGGVGAAGRWLALLLPESSREDLREGSMRAQEELSRIYASWGLWTSVTGHMLFRLGLTVEVWLALRFLGHPVDFGDALVLEGVNQALRAATFMIPGALGAQETGFVVLGSVLGVPTPVALSVSLCKRARELLVGLPALLAWQVGEGFGSLSRERSGQRE